MSVFNVAEILEFAALKRAEGYSEPGAAGARLDADHAAKEAAKEAARVGALEAARLEAAPVTCTLATAALIGLRVHGVDPKVLYDLPADFLTHADGGKVFLFRARYLEGLEVFASTQARGLEILPSTFEITATKKQIAEAAPAPDGLLADVIASRRSSPGFCDPLPEDRLFDLTSGEGRQRTKQYQKAVNVALPRILQGTHATMTIERAILVQKGVRGFLLAPDVCLELLWSSLVAAWDALHPEPKPYKLTIGEGSEKRLVDPPPWAQPAYLFWSRAEIGAALDAAAAGGAGTLIGPDETFRPDDMDSLIDRVLGFFGMEPKTAQDDDRKLQVISATLTGRDTITSDEIWTALRAEGLAPAVINNDHHRWLLEACQRQGFKKVMIERRRFFQRETP